MIQIEILNDGKFIHFYSDSGLMIRQIETGIEYSDAIDIAPGRYTYEETDTPIPDPDIEEKAAAWDVLMGGAR